MNKQFLFRLWHTLRLYTILGSGKRANYLRDHQVFHHIGENCTIMERKVPLYSKLISIGDNVHLASKVYLVPHDAIHLCLNNLDDSSLKVNKFKESIGCIEIGDNVFIGSNTIVLYDVKIGSNCIIGAGSLVNKDIPDNSVVVGTPARVIGSFDDFMNKRLKQKTYPSTMNPVNNDIQKALEEWCWQSFYQRRKEKNRKAASK